MMKIEDNVPLPRGASKFTRRGGNKGYTEILRKLGEGQSVVLPCSRESANALARTVLGGGKFLCRAAVDGTRVWRHDRAAAAAKRIGKLPSLGQKSSAGRKLYFSVNEFCDAVGISRAHFWNMAKSGQVPKSIKMGSRRLISNEAVEEWRKGLEGATK